MKETFPTTEIKKEKVLQAKYKHLQDHSPTGIMILNKKGIIIEANRTIAKKLSLRKKEILKQSVFEFIDSKGKKAFSSHLKKIFSSHNTASHNITVQMKGKTDTTLYAHVKSVLFREYAAQGLILCKSFFTDITPWKQIEDEQKKNHSNHLEYLECFSTFVNEDIREGDLLEQAATQLNKHFQPDILAILILNKNKYLFESLFVMPSIPLNKLFKLKMLSNPSICYTMRTGKESIVKNIQKNPVCECLYYKTKKGGYICMPLTINKSLLGMILLVKGEKGYWNREDNYKYLSIYANLITAAIYKIRQADYSTCDVIDEYTGIYNRKFFDQILEKQINIAKKNQKPLSIIIISIHEINSTYENGTGEQVLRQIIHITKKSTRASDVTARYSENAIGIIMPNMGMENAIKKAVAIKQTIESFVFIDIGDRKNIKVAATFGFATFPDHGTDPNILAGIASSAKPFKTRKK